MRSDNDLFLYCNHKVGENVTVAIGSQQRKRAATFTPDDALKLAYRLMALARGGETQGIETFKREG